MEDEQKAKEPREWTICSLAPPYADTVAGGPKLESEHVKVIEKSAYDELKSLAEKMAESMRYYVKMHSKGCAIVEYGACSCDVDKMHAALSEYRARYPDTSDALKETKRE